MLFTPSSSTASAEPLPTPTVSPVPVAMNCVPTLSSGAPIVVNDASLEVGEEVILYSFPTT